MRMWWTACAVWMWSSMAFAGTVSFKGADGAAVSAEELGTGAKGVVLVPGAGRTRAEWADVAAGLSRAGFHVVAVDVRQAGTDGTWTAAAGDLRAAVMWLRSKGATQVAVIGADVGGSLALHVAAAEAGITSVGLFSPKLNVPGVDMTAALAALGARPLLVVVGSTDTTGVRVGTALTQESGRRLRVVEGGTTGVQLFRQASDLQGALVGWLTDAATTPGGPRAGELRAGDSGALETSGTRIGEKP